MRPAVHPGQQIFRKTHHGVIQIDWKFILPLGIASSGTRFRIKCEFWSERVQHVLKHTAVICIGNQQNSAILHKLTPSFPIRSQIERMFIVSGRRNTDQVIAVEPAAQFIQRRVFIAVNGSVETFQRGVEFMSESGLPVLP